MAAPRLRGDELSVKDVDVKTNVMGSGEDLYLVACKKFYNFIFLIHFVHVNCTA